MTMYRISLKCVGVPKDEGLQASREIERDFQTREWHVDVHCWWDGNAIFITAWNDFDDTGLALRDEFSDLISAHVRTAFDGDIQTVEVLSMN